MINTLFACLNDWKVRRRSARLLQWKQTLDKAVNAALEGDDPSGLETGISGYRSIAEQSEELGLVDLALSARQAEIQACYELGSGHMNAVALQRCIESAQAFLDHERAGLSADDTAGWYRLIGHCHAELAHINEDPGALRLAVDAYQASLERSGGGAKGSLARLTERNIEVCRREISGLEKQPSRTDWEAPSKEAARRLPAGPPCIVG